MLLVKVLAPAARVGAALPTQGEVVEAAVGELVVEVEGRGRRLVAYGGGRYLEPDTQLEVECEGGVVGCPSSVARLPTAGLVVVPLATHPHPAPGTLVVLHTMGHHLTLLHPTLHLITVSGVEEAAMCPFSPSSPLVVAPLHSFMSAAQLCARRDAALARWLGPLLPGEQERMEEDGEVGKVEEDKKLKAAVLAEEVVWMNSAVEEVPVRRQECEETEEQVEVKVLPSLPAILLAKEKPRLVVDRRGKEGAMVVRMVDTLNKLERVMEGVGEVEEEVLKLEVGSMVLYGGAGGSGERGVVEGVEGEVVEVLLVDSLLPVLCHPTELRVLPSSLREESPAALVVHWEGGEVGRGEEVQGRLSCAPAGVLHLAPA